MSLLGEKPPTPVLGQIEDFFQTLVWDNLTQAAITALAASIPALKVWPLSAVIGYILTKFSNNLYGLLRKAVDLKAIVLTNDAHRKEFDAAVVKLSIYERSYGTGSPEYQKARDDAKASLSQFVRYLGV